MNERDITAFVYPTLRRRPAVIGRRTRRRVSRTVRATDVASGNLPVLACHASTPPAGARNRRDSASRYPTHEFRRLSVIVRHRTSATGPLRSGTSRASSAGGVYESPFSTLPSLVIFHGCTVLSLPRTRDFSGGSFQYVATSARVGCT